MSNPYAGKYLSEIEKHLVKTCEAVNEKELKMRCSRCGKHFAVYTSHVASELKRGRKCQCSTCGTDTLEPVPRRDDGCLKPSKP